MNPLVSVCIPAYNNAEYIGETIESILAQTHDNLELIIVDDNSKDDTYKVISEYAAKDSRVHVYHNEENLGMSGNWSYCLKLSRGDYIKLVCADDLLAPNLLERELQIFEENPGIVLVNSDTQLIDLNGRNKGFYKRYIKKGRTPGKKIIKRGFFSRDLFGAPQANTFPREVYEQVGDFSSEFTYIVDYDFFIRIAKLGDVYVLREALNGFRVRSDSNTGQVMGGDKEKTAIYIDEHVRLFKKNQADLELSDGQIELAVFLRKIRCFMAYVYLKIMVR